jgi:phage terminase large subunit GpA-like protein
MKRLEDLPSAWLPTERLPLSQWAEENLILSPEYSARTGHLKLYPWQRAIFDSFTDPQTEQITIMCGTQLVKTLFIQAAIAYVIAVDPGPILAVQCKDEDAKKFSKERLSPMIRDTPLLRELVAEPKSRDSSNTIQHKKFPGGTIDLVGTMSPANLARRSIRYLFFDEVDRYLGSSGAEGDPVDLGIRRTVTYGSRAKVIMTCSPTIAGESRIAAAYEATDQRKPYVACHDCGTFQVLEWARTRWSVHSRPATGARIAGHIGPRRTGGATSRKPSSGEPMRHSLARRVSGSVTCTPCCPSIQWRAWSMNFWRPNKTEKGSRCSSIRTLPSSGKRKANGPPGSR